MARINGTSAKNNYGFYALLTETLGNNYLNTNTTTVKYEVYIVNVNARTESGNWTFNAKIDGSNVYNKTGQTLKTNDTDYNKPKLVFSGSKDVKHENNGSKTITFSASLTKSTAYSLYDPGKCSLSGNFTLTTIPRASTIEAVSGYIGETTTLYIGRKSDSFTEKLTWSCENLSGTIENLNNETNVPFTIPTSLYALIPNDKQIDVTISCITYNGTTQVGEGQTTTLTARVDETKNKPIINEPVITETNTKVSNLTNKLVLNASRPKITINASGQNGASIKSIITTNKDGQSYSGDDVVFNTIGTAKFTIDVTDTRDLPNSKQIDKTEEAIPYVQPNIKTISIDRLSPTSGEIILSLIGSFYKGYIDKTENELNISYRYKENVTDATWSDLIRVPNNSIDFDTTNNSYSLTDFSLGQITQYNKQYVFEIYYSDVLVTDAKPLTRAVKKGVPTFDYGEHDLKVNGDLFVADEDGLNKINILDKIKELQSGDIDLSDYATKKELEDYAKSADLSTVATTGKYYDLLDEPTKISSFENDKGYITGYTETDPTVPSHVKNIKSTDITNWNNKSNFSGSYNDLTNKPDITSLETKTDASAKLTEAKNYTDTKIGDLIGTAPETLDTIYEVAEAIKENEDVIDALNESIGKKANTSDLSKVATSGSYNDLSNKPTIPTVPTNISAFNNDKGYLTSVPSEYVTDSELNAKGYLTSFTEQDPTVPAFIKAIKESDIANWNTKGLPQLTSPVRLYNLATGVYKLPLGCVIQYDGADGDRTFTIEDESVLMIHKTHENYKTFIAMGGISSNYKPSVYTGIVYYGLGNYSQFDFDDYVTETELSSSLNSKVDKVNGKGLSTNDYTTNDMNKLAGIEANANKTTVEDSLESTSTTNALSAARGKELSEALYGLYDELGIFAEMVSGMIPTDNSQLTNGAGYITTIPSEYITDSELTTALNGKVDKVSGKGLSTNDYTTAEKTKLSNIENGANKTVVNNTLTSTSTAEALSAAKGKDLQEQIDATNEEFGIWVQGITNMVTEKQDKLVSGTNIKTVKGQSILGSGDIGITDGVTPDISIGNVTTLSAGSNATVTKRGTTTNPIFDFGIPKGATGGTGSSGKDGVGISSVTQTTTSTADGGTNVMTVTKTDGTTSTFSVKNGSKGSAGTNGTNGRDGTSATHSWNGTTLTITSASGTSSANLKGEKGDKGDDGKDAKVYYGTCTTAASTQAKVVTCSDFVLETGAVITVKFTNAQTYNGTATLNVNSTGAKDICRVGTTTTTRYYWSAGEVVDFVYDGTNYVMEGKGLATTTYYGVTKLSSSTSSTSTSLAATPSAVKSAYDLANSKQDALVSGTNIKTINGESILGEGNITISSGGTVASTDVRVNGTSITSNGVANLITESAYNSSTNKIATKNDIPTNNNQLTNGAGYITGISKSDVTTALGYTPYNSTNPNGYTSNTGTITGVSANGTSVATSGVADIPPATTTRYGVTLLSSSTSSTSTSLAATPSAVKSAYDLANGKQDKLVSGTNIKTINGESLLGSGNITTESAEEDFSSKVTFNETPGNTYFYKKNGIVYITYQSAAATHNADSILFTLPTGYKPKAENGQTQFFIPFIKNAAAYGTCFIRLSDGVCKVSQISSTTTNGRIYFNISYVCE